MTLLHSISETSMKNFLTPDQNPRSASEMIQTKVSTFVMLYYYLLHWGEKKERIGRKPFTCTLDASTLKFSRKCPSIGHKLLFMHVYTSLLKGRFWQYILQQLMKMNTHLQSVLRG